MNKKLFKSIALMIIMVMAVVALTGCSKDEVAGVEFYYPENYVSVGTDTQPLFMDPEIVGASVNLVTADMPDAMTFDGYIEASILGIKNQMTVEGDINKEYVNVNGVKAAKLDYVATSSGQTMALTQVAIEKSGKVYVLTAGSLKDDAEAMQPKIENMIKSFK